MLAKLVSRILYLSGVIFVAWVLVTLADFHYKQAFSLSILIVGAAGWLFELTKVLDVSPYTLQVSIDHDAIRSALRLVSEGLPSGEFAEFVTITERLCVRIDNEKTFYLSSPLLMSHLRTQQPITKDFLSRAYGSPSLRFRRFGGTYRLELRLEDDWWRLQRSKVDVGLNRELSFEGALLLAELPTGYLPQQIRQWFEPVKISAPASWRQRRWRKRLEDAGWTYEEFVPNKLVHRFMSITYDGLHPD